MQIKKQQLEPDMEQRTGSKLEKEYIKAIYCHPAYLTSVQSTSCEMPDETQAGIKIAQRNINNLRYGDDTTRMAESEEALQVHGILQPEHWSGQPSPSPGDLPNPGIEPRSPILQVDSLPAEPPGKPENTGVGSLSLLQGIFSSQGSNPGLPYCRWIL